MGTIWFCLVATILVGVLALLVLVMHGSLWVQMKTSGAVNQRAGKLAGGAWWGVLVLTALVTAVTFRIQPQVKENFVTWPWGFVFPLLAVAGIAGVRFELVRRDERKAFFASCAYLTGMLTSVGFGVYPMVLPARNPLYSLTVSSAKAGVYGLKIGLGVVDHRRHPGRRLLHLCVPLLRRQSDGRKRPTPRILRVDPAIAPA